jgi:chemotaxis protein MotB
MRSLLFENDPAPGAPEWAVTFGDLMSLLLTFFILLVSMSEIKKNDRFQGIADSIQQQFGRDALGGLAGGLRPRNSEIASFAVTGRELRKKYLAEDAPPEPDGTTPRVQLIRAGERTTIGTVIYFDGDATALSPENGADLRSIAGELRGKPQMIEVRAHPGRRPPQPTENIRDHWDLAYERCRQTQAYLVTELRIDPARIRLSVAPSGEAASSVPEQRRDQPRVEVFLLEETAN